MSLSSNFTVNLLELSGKKIWDSKLCNFAKIVLLACLRWKNASENGGFFLCSHNLILTFSNADHNYRKTNNISLFLLESTHAMNSQFSSMYNSHTRVTLLSFSFEAAWGGTNTLMTSSPSTGFSTFCSLMKAVTSTSSPKFNESMPLLLTLVSQQSLKETAFLNQ